VQDRYDALIVGGGHGGASAAIALRRFGFEGTVAIVSMEPDLPYERPPLSKDYLAGERPFERMLFRPEAFWKEQKIELLLGREVTAIAAEERRVALADGARLSYGALIWSAGGSARRLSCTGHDLAGVHSVRSRADVDALRAELPGTGRVVVIGGGYIGLEAAAILTKLGKQVVVVEAADRLLARVASQPLSDFLLAQHRGHGVDVRLGATVDCIEEQNGAASAVRLADGSLIAADMVIVGIGIDPCITPLVAAGAEAASAGVRVDECCRTSLPHIFAIGDCAEHSNAFADGAFVRLESVQNATDQAAVAARAVMGAAEPYAAIPWFWSEQYDFRLQTVGLALGHDAIIVRGDPAVPGFSLLYLKEGRAIALDCIGNVKDYVQGRMLITSRQVIDPDRLADASVPIKSMLA
jgi:3-phenylpropionate/trans-cinnamate dioxygenase ferredoxin reductase subunit